jgi:hypothetical protein
MSSRATIGLRLERFHFDGSSAASTGMSVPRLEGNELIV